MGAITPIIGGLNTAVSTLNTLGRIAGTARALSGNSPGKRERELALRQLQERQARQQAQLARQNDVQRQRLDAQAQADEQGRRRVLQRAVARQRAQFGARGIAQEGGSAQAVLLGLFDETEEQLQSRARLDSLRKRALDLKSEQTRSLNLLQATQLAQRHKIANQRNFFDRLF